MQSTTGLPDPPSRNFNTALPPDLPGPLATTVHAIESDLVLEGVHRHPEAVVLEPEQCACFDESRKGLLHELLAGTHVLEQLLAEHHVATIDPEVRFLR